MQHIRALILAATVVVAFGPMAYKSQAEDVQAVFDSLYGAELERVKLTASRDDDLVLAEKLFEAAKASSAQATLAKLLCHKVFELGSTDVRGYSLAISAAQFLADIDPEHRIESFSMASMLAERAFRRGSSDQKRQLADAYMDVLLVLSAARLEQGELVEATNVCRKALSVSIEAQSSRRSTIKAHLDHLRAKQAVFDQIQVMTNRLSADAKDDEAGESLFWLYIAELDDAAKASPYVTHISDPTAKAMAAMAVQKELPTSMAQVLELADWYHALAEKPPVIGRSAMLHRARTCYEKYLLIDTRESLGRTKAMLALEKIEKLLQPEQESTAVLSVQAIRLRDTKWRWGQRDDCVWRRR